MTIRTAARWVSLLVLLAGVVAYAAGGCHGDRIAPGRLPPPPEIPTPGASATAVRAPVPVLEEAVGTVRSRRRVAVAAQVTAGVVSLGAEVGDRVQAGAPLVALDDADAAARFARARSQHERVRRFLARQAATAEQMEGAEAEFLQAKAALEHTRIAAPIDGIVAERDVEPGDLAVAGRPLLVVLDPEALRLEAQVRERLIARIAPGARLDVELPAAGVIVPGTVAEVLPAADPQSRSFEVRVNFDRVAGVYPGMFGRLRLPVGERDAVRVPTAAVVRVGQLDTVVVATEEGWARRLVTTGAADAGWVEVLSGLRGGERVGFFGGKGPS